MLLLGGVCRTVQRSKGGGGDAGWLGSGRRAEFLIWVSMVVTLSLDSMTMSPLPRPLPLGVLGIPLLKEEPKPLHGGGLADLAL